MPPVRFSISDPPLFVPETKFLIKSYIMTSCNRGIKRMNCRTNLLEDISKKSVGDIWDEFDKEENHILKINDNQYVALGKTKLDEINETLDVNISVEDDDYDTLGGLF